MTIALDDRDIRILQILSQEGRISKAALARRVNLSPTPCWERLKRLETTGLIRGYRAEISLTVLTGHVSIFVVVELESHRAVDFKTFETEIELRDRIVGCWALGGGFDYLLQIVAPSIDSYQRLMDELLGAGIGLKRYFTYVVTKEVKSAPPPLDVLLQKN